MITVHSLIAKIKRPEPISKVTVQTRMYYMIQYYTVCRHLVILHGNVLLTHKPPLKGPVVQFCFFLCTGDKKEMYVLIFVISQRPFQTQPVYGQATYMATRAHTLRCVYLLNTFCVYMCTVIIIPVCILITVHTLISMPTPK